MNDSSSNNEMELISTALVNFDRVSAGLAALERNYKGVLYDVDTSLGMDHAKAARAAIREPRYEVERVRKGAKAPLLALGKRLDAEATRITNALMTLELPIDEQIKSEEKRKDDEKQAKAAAEAKRVADIQTRIDQIRNYALGVAGYPPALIDQEIDELQGIVIDATFAEFEQVAADAKGAALSKLAELRAGAIKQEEEQARIKAERAELAKLRAEQDARAKEQRAQLEQQERTAKAIRDAEDQRLARERADLESREKEWARQNTAPTLAPEPVKQGVPSRRQILAALSLAFNTDENTALRWMKMIDWEAR
jgi:hypothetical protein